MAGPNGGTFGAIRGSTPHAAHRSGPLRPAGAFGARSARAVLLGIQLLGAWAPLADAQLDAGNSAFVHIEERSERSCDPLHLHDDCALCQHITHADAVPAPVMALSLAPSLTNEAPSTNRLAPLHRTPLHARGRSPPEV